MIKEMGNCGVSISVCRRLCFLHPSKFVSIDSLSNCVRVGPSFLLHFYYLAGKQLCY